MKIRLISIAKRTSKTSAMDELSSEYVKRAGRYGSVELCELASEEALLKSL